MKNYKYKWSKPHRVDAQIAGEIFQRCSNDEEVVALAAAKDHPLHGEFDWNDTTAAAAHRVCQARQMRCSLHVEVITRDREAQVIRAFVRTVDRVGYVPTLEANEEEIGAEEKKCWLQMKAFRAKWKSLRFARELIDVINEKERRVQRRKKR